MVHSARAAYEQDLLETKERLKKQAHEQETLRLGREANRLAAEANAMSGSSMKLAADANAISKRSTQLAVDANKLAWLAILIPFLVLLIRSFN